MRRKIKELLSKEEGFTLVELLAVLAILAIIVAIAIPAIGNVIGSSETKADEASRELIVDAARLYDVEATEGRGEGDEFVTVDYLVENGYLDLRSGKNTSINGKHGVHVERVENGGTKYNFKTTAPSGVTLKDATP